MNKFWWEWQLGYAKQQRPIWWTSVAALQLFGSASANPVCTACDAELTPQKSHNARYQCKDCGLAHLLPSADASGAVSAAQFPHRNSRNLQ